MKYLTFSFLVAMLLLFSSCTPEIPDMRQYSFNATLEQPTSEDNNGQKVYLDNERWVYWEVDDEINLCGDGTSVKKARLINTDNEHFNGVFVASFEWGASYFLGLHPYSASNEITNTGGSNFSARISLPAEQPRRTDERGDLTFDKQVYPMVAWYGGASETPDLDFHALGSIVRLNIFNNTGSATTLNSIEITSRDGKQLSGLFDVHNYKTEDPYLTAAANTTANQKVTLTCGSGLNFGTGNLYTFYLVLPALAGRGDSTIYNLTMTVNSVAGTFTKNFTVKTRRTGMTNMKAMGINAWGAGDGTVGLSGCGTESRPFKVYDIADLQYLRSCYNAAVPPDTRTINGQPITPDTYITLMRTDITLTTSNWTEGIQHFVGHLTDATNRSNPGITTTCQDAPLFESIDQGGVVEGITLKSAATFSLSEAVSPFCTTNSGVIRNCVLTTVPGSSAKNRTLFADFAGLCVTNSGTIEGCRFQGSAEIGSGKNFAAICLTNNGEITGCQTSSIALTFNATGSTAAGICYTNGNNGTVRDSYFAADIVNSAVDWAGIVFDNSGTVEHCYLSATGHIYTTKTVAGIVMNNTADGKVDYCWLAGPLRGVNAAGIVQNLSGGQVINCFNSGNAMITVTSGTSVCGGLVGTMSGGSIENSYVDDITLISQQVGASVGAIVATASSGTVNNCYASDASHTFYGTNSGATLTHCYLVEGTQTGTTREEPTAYETLQSNLNTYKPSGGKGWQGAANATTTPTVTSGTPPQLEPYTQPTPASGGKRLRL